MFLTFMKIANLFFAIRTNVIFEIVIGTGAIILEQMHHKEVWQTGGGGVRCMKLLLL